MDDQTLSPLARRAHTLHADALVWDNHICLPMALEDNLKALPDLLRYKAVGTDIISINIGYANYSLENHLTLAQQMRAWFTNHPNEFVLVKSTNDILAAKARGAISVVFDIEGGKVLDGDISLLAQFAELGVRWMALAYNKNNVFAGGCHDEDSGLSDLGRKLIDEMDRVGISVCCSHTGYDTAREVIDYVTKPMLFSHSNPRGLTAHPRNIPDDLIDACAAKGGVIGINGVNAFLGQSGKPTARRLAEHINYVVQRVGSGAVSLALDSTIGYSLSSEMLRGSGLFPTNNGYDDLCIMEPEQTPYITEALLDIGLGDEDVRKILGLNLMRIAETNWKS
jgi:membrane dipeptidase